MVCFLSSFFNQVTVGASPINDITNCASMFFVSSETHLIVTHHDGFQSGIELFDGQNWRNLFLGSLSIISVFKYSDKLAMYLPTGNFSQHTVSSCSPNPGFACILLF